MSKKQESNSEYKRKQNFMCCSCFGRKKSSSSFSVIGLSEQNEPYEYIVEKLAIKKVPLSLFATTEDLEKHSKTISSTSTPSNVSQKSGKAVPTTLPLREKKPSVTFSAYFKLTPKSDIEQFPQCLVAQNESPSLTSLHYDEPETIVHNTAIQRTTKPKTIMSEEQEKEMVSQILNKHSSLFTLDTKEAIPKDPDNLPKNKVVVPPLVQAVLNNPTQEQFPPLHGRRQIRVDVHRACESPPPKLPPFIPSMKSPATIPPSKKELTPELKQTINALGFAQRPHLPGVPPKNQRSIQGGSICDEVIEKEISSNVLGGDHVIEGTPSQEMICHALELKEKRPFCKPTQKKTVTMVTRGSFGESDYDVFCDTSNSKMHYSQGNVPRLGRNLIVEQYNDAESNKCILTPPDRSSNHVDILSANDSESTSEPRLQESEQTTEISQLKGQSLKWKIIIKHHADKKDKEDRVISEKSDISDSDSESKPYLLSNRSLSPNR